MQEPLQNGRRIPPEQPRETPTEAQETSKAQDIDP